MNKHEKKKEKKRKKKKKKKKKKKVDPPRVPSPEPIPLPARDGWFRTTFKTFRPNIRSKNPSTNFFLPLKHRVRIMSSPNVEECRMYEAKYPAVDDLVVVEVQQIAEMGAYGV
jgi:hypothetical protein